MSNNFSVNVGNQKITINVGDKIEDIKKKFGDNAETIFKDIDKNNNGKLDANEINGLKTNIENADFEIEEDENDNTPVHGNTSARAYNTAIQNLKNKYKTETLTGFFKSADSDLHTIKKGDTLYTIAKKALEAEGLPTDYKSINNRIAEIANINNLPDINNVAIGTKLKVNLTDAGVAKVKENSKDSVKAFTGQARTDEAGEDWTNIEKRRSTASQKADQTDETAETTTVAKAPTSDKTSTITLTRNGLNMGAGVPVDKDGKELTDKNGKPDFKDAEFKNGGGIMKYTQGDKVMYQKTYPAKAGNITNAVALSAPTIEELNDLKKKFTEAFKKLKPLDDKDDDATKKTKSDANLAALKELIEITGGNTQVIQNIAEYLKGGTHQWVNKDADNTKAFVQDLILTRNADVVRALTTDKDGNVDMSIVEKDKKGFETLAGLYQEIRNKEKDGVKLTDAEVDLKEVLANTKWEDGFVITEANEEKHVDAKTLRMNNDGKLIFRTTVSVGDTSYYFWASDEGVLDSFVKDFKAANTDDKKKALFTKYANTGDVELANCLMLQVQNLHASDEDIKTVIKNNGVYVLAALQLTDSDGKNIASKDVIAAMIARYKEIYTGKDKGNLENAEFLTKAADWINRSEMSDDEKEAAKAELAETYFDKTTTKDEEGKDKVEYTFNPSRRPTKEEMEGLASIAEDAMKVALVNYEKYEDMGKGQYSEAIGDNIDSKELIAHRAAMVENMSSADDVIDFINNKVTVDKNWDIPFDKIIEKFDNDKKVFDALLNTIAIENQPNVSDNAINNDNRIKLLHNYIKDGKVEKSLLPQGYDAKKLTKILPRDCKQEPAKATFTILLQEFGHNDVDALSTLRYKNPDAVKARLGELVKTCYNKDKKTLIKPAYEFLDKICNLPAEIRPKAELKELLNSIKLGPDAKAKVFKAVNGYTLDDIQEGNKFINDFENRAKFLREDGVTPDNVVGIIKSLDEVTSDNKTGVHKSLSIDTNNLLFLITGPKLAVGKRPSMALCNRIPKALMRKAIAMELTETEAYKDLEKFYGATYNADKLTLTFTKNDEANKVYTNDKTTQEASKLIRALVEEIIKKS